MSHDLRFALRILARSPGVTAAAVLSLALAIGAVTAVFSLLNAVFLKSLPAEDPDRLVSVYTAQPGQIAGAFMPLSRPNFLDLKARSDGVFSDLCESYDTSARLEVEGGEPEIVHGKLVSGDYFSTYGVAPHLGRLIEPADTANAAAVVVLSHRFWRQRFAADPNAVGRAVELGGRPMAVIGVAPPGFVGTMVLSSAAFWAPISMRPTLGGELPWDDRHALATWATGRLRPGVERTEAEAAVRTIARSLAAEHPEANDGRVFGVLPIHRLRVPFFLHDRYLRAGRLLLAVAGLVLLVACANTANLLLGRAAARRREMAVRRALGAPRRRLVRQLLTESLVLAAAAGAAGWLVALWMRNALWTLSPAGLRDNGLDVGFDHRVLGFAVLISTVTGLAFGVAPALRASRPGWVHDLVGAVERSRIWRFRHFLVMAQVALSFVALVGSGLFRESWSRALEIRPGFEPEKLLTLRLRLRYGAMEPEPSILLERILDEVRAAPGVASASLSSLMPLVSGGRWRTVLWGPKDGPGRLTVPTGVVETDFFEASGIEIVRGRALMEGDRHGAPVAVVNETLAARLWPGGDALGRRLRYLERQEAFEVVGVVRDVDYNAVGEAKKPIAFLPRRPGDERATTLVVRTHGEPGTSIEPIRRIIRSLAPDLPVTHVRTGAEILGERLGPVRLGAGLMSGLAAVALLMAVVGIYGVTAYSTRQRHREISIRMALGAGRADVTALVVGQGMRVVGIGLAFGLGLATAAGRFVVGLLHGVEPANLSVLTAALLVLAAVALAAHLLPARQAAATRPAGVLRAER